MKSKVSIVVMVDAVGALSDGTLHNGNLCMVDDSPLGSRHPGSPNLVTAVQPGQVVQWTPIHVDVQTPVEIDGIEFLAGPSPAAGQHAGQHAVGQHAVGQRQGGEAGRHGAPGPMPGYARPAPTLSGAAVASRPETRLAEPPIPMAMSAHGFENHDLLVWEGIVPDYLVRGVPYRYRLSVRLHAGPQSVLHIDSPALLRV